MSPVTLLVVFASVASANTGSTPEQDARLIEQASQQKDQAYRYWQTHLQAERSRAAEIARLRRSKEIRIRDAARRERDQMAKEINQLVKYQLKRMKPSKRDKFIGKFPNFDIAKLDRSQWWNVRNALGNSGREFDSKTRKYRTARKTASDRGIAAGQIQADIERKEYQLARAKERTAVALANHQEAFDRHTAAVDHQEARVAQRKREAEARAAEAKLAEARKQAERVERIAELENEVGVYEDLTALAVKQNRELDGDVDTLIEELATAQGQAQDAEKKITTQEELLTQANAREKELTGKLAEANRRLAETKLALHETQERLRVTRAAARQVRTASSEVGENALLACSSRNPSRPLLPIERVLSAPGGIASSDGGDALGAALGRTDR